MTPSERRAIERLTRGAARLTPALEAALVEAVRNLQALIGEVALAKALRDGTFEQWMATALSDPAVWQAYAPVREALRLATETAAVRTMPTIPLRPRSSVTIAFDRLAPQVVTAVRTLQTEVVTRLATDLRQTLRQRVEAGLVAGEHPRATARALKDVVPLAPNQEQAIRNYEAALRAGQRGKAKRYALRDKRFDGPLARGELTPTRIAQMTAAYRRRMIAFNAETQARTAALESQRLGQRLAWQDAEAQGTFDGVSVVRVWVATLDSRVRPEHAAMHRSEAPLNGRYPNGDRYPGESSPWNCRCTEIIAVRRA